MGFRGIQKTRGGRIWLYLIILFGAPITADAADGLSERTYRNLTAIHELMDKERYDEALDRLHALSSTVSGKRYERAVVLQTYGHLYVARGQYAPAIENLAKALETGGLPKSVKREIYYLLAQLYLAQSDYGSAATNIERWLKSTKKTTADGHALAGIIYARGKRHADAVKQFEKAIAAAAKPKESWFRHLLAIHYELGHYNRAARLLERMVALFPDHPNYWLDLANTYRAMGEDQMGLAALETAHQLGLVSAETDVLNLARLYLHLGIPAKAARILETGLADGVVHETQENWCLLSDAWLLARELEPALNALERASGLSSNGQLHLRRARLLAEAQRWNGTLRALQAAFAAGKLETPGQAHLLAGVARHETGDHKAALLAFQRAAEFPETRRQASHWLERLDREEFTLNKGQEK
jgi:tetratricopeptide (TPR) repeat protein